MENIQLDTPMPCDEAAPKKTHIPPLAKIVGVCALLPMCMMTLVYLCFMVWPVGENAVLVLDLNAQYVYYFEKLRNILVSGDSLLYSFERALGGEFMGIFAYYLSSPLSVLVALLPKSWMTESMFLLMVIKTGLCGASFGYFLLKTRQSRPIWTVLFSSMYALCSYVVVLQHNIMWLDNVILFPLILYGMDVLIREGKFRLYVGALALAILSNFYIGYMTCFFIAIYFFIRYATMSVEERGAAASKLHFAKNLVKILVFSLLAVLITAVIILPVYYSLSFGKLEFSDPDYTPKQLFDFLKLLTKAYFGSYDSVRPAGMPFLYCGTLALLLVPLYFAAPKICLRHKIGNLLTVGVLFVGFNLSTLDIIWHGLQRPNWLNARFAYMFAFFAVLMAYDSFIHLRETGTKKILSCAIGASLLLIVMQAMEYSNVQDFLTVWASLFFIVGFTVLVPYALQKNGEDEGYLFSNPELFLVMFVVFELICNGVAMVYSLDADVSFTTRSSYRNFVDKYSEATSLMEEIDAENYGEDSFYRSEKVVHRKKNDSFAIDINGLSNSTSTLNAKSIEFLKRMGLSARSHWSMYYGGNPVTNSLLGLRYVMTEEETPTYISDYYMLQGTTEEEISIWENVYNLGIAFGVSEELFDYALYNQEEDTELEENGLPSIRETYENACEYTTPFDMMNQMLSAMVGYEVEVFTPVDARQTEIVGVTRTYTTGHTGFKKGTGNTNRVEYSLDVEEALPIYYYFPSDYPRDATVKLDKKVVGTFFEDDSFCVQELGILSEGEHPFYLELEEDNLYIANGCKYFWYFHEDVYFQVIEELQHGSMEAFSTRDDRISGTITLEEGKTAVYTTIPYDEGWKIYVDGVETEAVSVMDTMLGFITTAGTHSVELRYEPDCVKYGLILSAGGVVVYVLLSVWDIRRRRYYR